MQYSIWIFIRGYITSHSIIYITIPISTNIARYIITTFSKTRVCMWASAPVSVVAWYLNGLLWILTMWTLNGEQCKKILSQEQQETNCLHMEKHHWINQRQQPFKTNNQPINHENLAHTNRNNWILNDYTVCEEVLFVTPPTQHQLNSKVGCDTKMTLIHHHHHPPPPHKLNVSNISAVTDPIFTKLLRQVPWNI